MQSITKQKKILDLLRTLIFIYISQESKTWATFLSVTLDGELFFFKKLYVKSVVAFFLFK